MLPTAAKLQQELRDPEGFASYKELNLWFSLWSGVSLSYSCLYRCVRYELQSKLKVPRPKNDRQAEKAIENFKFDLPKLLSNIKSEIIKQGKSFQKIRYWCGDETRFGLQTEMARKLTIKGVKPIGIHHWGFKYFYIYGLVEPQNGNSFMFEFSHLDTICFEKFLQLFSERYPEDYHIIQIDNAPSHTSQFLEVPEKIFLLFQPPYCPEVNPIERLWEFVKSFLKWALYDQLDPLRKQVGEILKNLRPEEICSLTSYNFIIRSLSLAGL